MFNDHVAWRQFTERASFRNDYEAEFGRPPYVNSVAQFRRHTTANFPEGYFESISSKRKQFEAFIGNIFGGNFVMIMPFKFGEPEAADTYRPR